MWAQTSSHYFWSVRLLSVEMDGKSLHPSVKHVVFDTGASLNYMPSREWQHFKSQIQSLEGMGCYQRSMQGDLVCDCPNGPSDKQKFPTMVI